MKFSFLRLTLIQVAIIIGFFSMPLLADTSPIKPNTLQEKLAKLEVDADGRIGVLATNTANNSQLAYRAEERFSMNSTAKLMVVAAILKLSVAKDYSLQQKITYQKKDLVEYSPVTKQHLNGGMTIAELCAATIMQSDNTAMNLLTRKLGGPHAVTNFARSIGDNTFRLDRFEPEMNWRELNDLRDTSTPAAMETSLRQLVLGDVLLESQRKQLQTWLINNTTGDARIRAGLPKGWIVGDKTGSGDYGATNDIAVIWPPKCAPIVLTIYFNQNKKDAPPRDDVVASVTRMLLNEIAKTDQCIRSSLS